MIRINRLNSSVKRATHWFVVIVLAVMAFHVGSDLRAAQFFSMPAQHSSLQASALLKLTPEWAPVNLQTAKASDTEDRQLFRNVYNLVKANFVDPITPEMETSMSRGAVRGMVESLDDPDSRFMDPTERKLLDDAGNGRFYGIGAILALKKGKIDKPDLIATPASPKADLNKMDIVKIIVVAPMPGSPAEKAGIRSGDSITHVNGQWIITSDPFLLANLDNLSKAVRNKEIDEFEYQKAYDAAAKRLKDGMAIPKALEILTAKSSGDVTIKVDRPGIRQPLEFKMQCADTYSEPVTSRKLDSGIEYIRISQFSKSASASFAKEISRDTGVRSKGIILDLRNNPGGLMSSAADIAGRITGGGTLGTVIETARRRTVSMPKSARLNKPIVVLVNNGTASVAELVAASLREHGAGILVGRRTFGDGLTQTPLLLKDGSAAVITTGRMLTSKGIDFNGSGIEPDRIVTDTSKTEDTQLIDAQRILLQEVAELERAKLN